MPVFSNNAFADIVSLSMVFRILMSIINVGIFFEEFEKNELRCEKKTKYSFKKVKR